jgi:NADH-quinone oxidoreductase subunit M
VGEFLVLVGALDYQPLLGYVAAFTIVFAAVYLLYMLQNVVFGGLTDFLRRIGSRLTDVSPVEAATLAPLVVLAVAFGVFPALILDLITLPLDGILTAVDQGVAAARVP